jgi:hypothetical protein
MASWIARQRRRWRAPGWSRLASAWSPEWTVERRSPWRYRRSPAEQQVVEPVEGDLGRLGWRREALADVTPDEARVVAHHRGTTLVGLANPLAGRFRCIGEGRFLVDAGQGQRDPVPRRLDLLDRVEAAGRQRVAVAGVRGNLGVGRDDVLAERAEERCDGSQPIRGRGRGLAVQAHRATRDVRASAPDPRPGAAECQHAGWPLLAALDYEEVRPPAASLPVGGPRTRLVDVAARCIDGPLVPVGKLLGRCRPDLHPPSPASPPNDEALPPPRKPWRRRSTTTRARWAPR